MRLISWNTNRRIRTAESQAAALLERRPDIVSLQEVTKASVARLSSKLRAGGLEHVRFTLEAPQAELLTGPRAFGILVASRHPFASEPPRLPVPWAEKAVSVAIVTDKHEVEIHSVHVPPGSSHHWVKVEVLEGIARGLALASTAPRILCGDFNTPQHETAAGEIVTWAQRIDSDRIVTRTRFRGGSGARWDAAERNVLAGPLTDAFRALHGYERSEASWFLHRKGKVVGRRFDHILVSGGIRVLACRYHHEWRMDGLSDHSAIEADLEVESAASTGTN